MECAANPLPNALLPDTNTLTLTRQFEIEITCQILYVFDFRGVSVLLLIRPDWNFQKMFYFMFYLALCLKRTLYAA